MAALAAALPPEADTARFTPDELGFIQALRTKYS